MVEKFKENFNKIVFVAAIIAAGLLVPNVFNLFDLELTDGTFINLAFYLLLIAADIVFAVFAYKGKKMSGMLLLLPLALTLLSLSLGRVYDIFTSGDFSFIDVPYLALYVAILILYFISLTNKKLNVVLCILLLILTAMYVAQLFAGSVVGLSILITVLVLTYNAYNNNLEEKE